MYERYKGDSLLSKDKRLKYRWRWSRVASEIPDDMLKKWTHFQVSECCVGDWKLEAIQWGNAPVYYESVIEYNGNRIASVGDDRETGATTRIEAQIRAEKLFVDWITREYKCIVG